MTPQQIQLKIERFINRADRQTLDTVPLPGGRARFFAANPQSYMCNYAVVDSWLDVDDTICAAEEEFASQGVEPCRFFGTPDSLPLEELRPFFARHGYASKELPETETLVYVGGESEAAGAECALRWVHGGLDTPQRDFLRRMSGGAEFGLRHIQRQLQKGGGEMLFAYREEAPVAGLLFVPKGDTAMITDVYTHPDHRRQGLARRMVAEAAALFKRRGMALLFLQADTPEAKALYRAAGFVPVEMPAPWWAVKGSLPDWLKKSAAEEGTV